MNRTLPHTLDDFKISAGLINRFHKRLLSDGDDGIEIARAMKSKLETGNRLQNIIENYGLDRKRVQFKKLMQQRF